LSGSYDWVRAGAWAWFHQTAGGPATRRVQIDRDPFPAFEGSAVMVVTTTEDPETAIFLANLSPAPAPDQEFETVVWCLDMSKAPQLGNVSAVIGSSTGRHVKTVWQVRQKGMVFWQDSGGNLYQPSEVLAWALPLKGPNIEKAGAE
jgi:hypothetical protein